MSTKTADNQLFLLEDTRKYKFEQPIQKILTACPMFNNTVVIMGVKSHRTEFVGHYDADGKLLKEVTFYDSNLQEYCIPSDREFVFIDEDNDVILVWNLETHVLEKFDHKLNIEQADHHGVLYFPETKLLCVHEHGNKDSNFLRFTYYKYPLTKEMEPILPTFEGDDYWTYEYMVTRVNNRSGMAWHTNKMKE